MLQLGLMPSHFSFLFRQTMHAKRFGLGTLELPPAGTSAVVCSRSVCLSASASDTMMVSGGVSEDVDMAAAAPCAACALESNRSGTEESSLRGPPKAGQSAGGEDNVALSHDSSVFLCGRAAERAGWSPGRPGVEGGGSSLDKLNPAMSFDLGPFLRPKLGMLAVT